MDVITVLGWVTLGLFIFITICITIGVMSVEIIGWAKSLFKFGQRMRKKL